MVTTSNIKLDVKQNLTQDVAANRGFVAEQTEGVATLELLQKSSAEELVTAIEHKAIQDLPLNGRNFTQLWTLISSATPVSTAQSAGIGVGDLAVTSACPEQLSLIPLSRVSLIASTSIFLDGAIDTELTCSSYVVPGHRSLMCGRTTKKPSIVDTRGRSEHRDARWGDHPHSAWDLLCDNMLDACDPFEDEFMAEVRRQIESFD